MESSPSLVLCSQKLKKIIKISTLESCFIRDKDFPGNNLGDTKLENPEECQKWCQETQECEMFIYATKEFKIKDRQNDCYLKNNMADKYELTAEYGLVAGPKFCHNDGGNFCLIQYHCIL